MTSLSESGLLLAEQESVFQRDVKYLRCVILAGDNNGQFKTLSGLLCSIKSVGGL